MEWNSGEGDDNDARDHDDDHDSDDDDNCDGDDKRVDRRAGLQQGALHARLNVEYTIRGEALIRKWINLRRTIMRH